jgi:hypothetical protein
VTGSLDRRTQNVVNGNNLLDRTADLFLAEVSRPGRGRAAFRFRNHLDSRTRATGACERRDDHPSARFDRRYLIRINAGWLSTLPQAPEARTQYDVLLRRRGVTNVDELLPTGCDVSPDEPSNH